MGFFFFYRFQSLKPASMTEPKETADLTDKELDTVIIPTNEKDVSPPVHNATCCLVGRLCAEKPPNGFYLLEVMKKAWKAKKDLTAREWGNNLFLFSFKNQEDRDWVISHQPWHFENYLFAVAPLHGNEQPSTVRVTHCSFWIRAYDLPIMSMGSSTVKAIAKRIGTLESIDEDTNYTGSFVRFKVNLNLTEPLLRGVLLQGDKERIWIPLKYESLPIYCYQCGVIGHQSRSCATHRAPDNSFDDLRYGPWLKASPLKRARSSSDNNISSSPFSVKSLFKPSFDRKTTSPITDLTIPPFHPTPLFSNHSSDKSSPSKATTTEAYRPPHLRSNVPLVSPTDPNHNSRQLAPASNLNRLHALPHPTPHIPPLFPEMPNPSPSVSRKWTRKKKNLADAATQVNNSEGLISKRNSSSLLPEEEDLDLFLVNKKLKSSELFDVPCVSSSTAVIAMEQSRRSQ